MTKVKSILSAIDWKAKNIKFQLAAAVQSTDWDMAASIMHNVSAKEITQEDYATWPLFIGFRETEIFGITFREKFGQTYEDFLAERAKEGLLQIQNAPEFQEVVETLAHENPSAFPNGNDESLVGTNDGDCT